MKKNKIRHYETLSKGMFPQCYPKPQIGGETNQSGTHTQSHEGDMTNDPKETLVKIWRWIDGNDDVDDV